MGGIAVTTGTVRVRDCPEVKSIPRAFDKLARLQAVRGVVV